MSATGRCQRRGADGPSPSRAASSHGPVREAIRPHALEPAGQGVVPAHREREQRRLDPELARYAIVKSAEPSLAGLAGMFASPGLPGQADREKVVGPTEERFSVSRAGLLMAHLRDRRDASDVVWLIGRVDVVVGALDDMTRTVAGLVDAGPPRPVEARGASLRPGPVAGPPADAAHAAPPRSRVPRRRPETFLDRPVFGSYRHDLS